jgi:hypothetical protein
MEKWKGCSSDLISIIMSVFAWRELKKTFSGLKYEVEVVNI